MHVEIQVALNFFISFLYNKLPRRRVNQFGEELEKALKMKFQGHWYPEKPYKGSAFRCIKTAPPLDPVFDIAAQESGMALSDIQENLPEELSIWIDPGEVSYRLGEKGVVKILYSESESAEDRADREIYRTFNPEAQCFRPIVDPQGNNSVTSQLGSLSLSSGSSSSSSPFGHSPSPTASYKATSSSSPINGFLAKTTTPLTFTTATFAQTKFGSTKLKTNGKRSHRMSPTEFSSYIKQRAIIQQQQQQQHSQQQQVLFAASIAQQPSQSQQGQQRPRSLSPTPAANLDANSFLLLASAANMHHHHNNQTNFASPSQSHFSPRSQGLFDGYLNDIFSSNTNSQQELLTSSNSNTTKVISSRALPNMATVTANANALSLFFDNKALLNSNGVLPTSNGVIGFDGAATGESGNTTQASKGYDSNLNFNVGSVSYPNQHLLMAN